MIALAIAVLIALPVGFALGYNWVPWRIRFASRLPRPSAIPRDPRHVPSIPVPADTVVDSLGDEYFSNDDETVPPGFRCKAWGLCAGDVWFADGGWASEDRAQQFPTQAAAIAKLAELRRLGHNVYGHRTTAAMMLEPV